MLLLHHKNETCLPDGITGQAFHLSEFFDCSIQIPPFFKHMGSTGKYSVDVVSCNGRKLV
jgi:hypothetical protein